MFKIEKNIPTPVEGFYDHKYPFHGMDVGDSFFIPCTLEEKNRTKRNVMAAGRVDRTNKFFRTATVDGGIRVWRVK